MFETAGLAEIGVDVLPEHRGRGLAVACVTALCCELLDLRRIPFYGCEDRNVRSQHVAITAGFRPVCSYSVVMAAGIGIGDPGP